MTSRRWAALTTGVRRRWVVAALALLTAVVGIGATEATGVTSLSATVVRIVTGEGTLVVELDDPTVQVSLDGEELSITGLQELRLRPGQYQFQAIRDGEPIKQRIVTISRGDREVVRVTRQAHAGDVNVVSRDEPERPGWPSDAPPPAIAPFDAARPRRIKPHGQTISARPSSTQTRSASSSA